MLLSFPTFENSDDLSTRLIESSSVWKSVSRALKINLFLCSRSYTLHIPGTLLQGVETPWKLVEINSSFMWPISFTSVEHSNFTVGYFVRSLLSSSSKSQTQRTVRGRPGRHFVRVLKLIALSEQVICQLILRILILKFLTCFTRLTN